MRRTIFTAVFGMVSMIALLGCSQQKPEFGPVVEADELIPMMQLKPKKRPIILDVRTASAYDAGHVEGALQVEPDEWKIDSLAEVGGVEDRLAWQQRFGQMGLSPEKEIIVYDDGRMTEAARVWFILQWVGAPRTAVLNGGQPAIAPLLASGSLPMSTARTTLEPQKFRCWPPSEPCVALVEREDVRRCVLARQGQIWDARTQAEYTGVDKRNNTRVGHMPNAALLPHDQLLDGQGRLRSSAELADLLCRAGFGHGDVIITHCDGGGRASLASLAAVRAGFRPVWNYYRSFADYARDGTCPLEGQMAGAAEGGNGEGVGSMSSQ